MEMTPLIDVIFLLLTFFIFSFVVMVRADRLPVKIAALQSGQSLGPVGDLAWVTIGRDGLYYFRDQAVSLEVLRKRLKEFVAKKSHIPLRIQLQAGGRVDRGPLMIQLHSLMRQAGVKRYDWVGDPKRIEQPIEALP